jgi:hypothetical protein
MKQFLKKSELQLINGGYLSNKDGKPVYNEDFVNAQQHAEYIVMFAKLAKGKNFKDQKADSISDLRKEVSDFLSKNKKTTFVEKPKSIKRPTTDKLADEALEFIKFQKDSTRVDKINNFLQQFNILNEFEEFGLFFDDGIVKLNKICTLKEVVDAVTETIDLLD